MAHLSYLIRILGGLAAGLLVTWLAVLSWGEPAAFFAHPARAGVVVFLLILAPVRALVRGGGNSRGVREDVRNRWVLVPMILTMLVLLWLPPFGEPRGLWLVNGDGARYAGLVLFVAGAALRVGAIAVLKHRFSGLVAIQPDHELATGGLYRVIRHPGYLGLLLWLAGWCLVFRSGAGLIVTGSLVIPLITRINAEEALLVSEFGKAYDRYRRGTWRLLPYIY
jgi:protein-S-isoprenylcysteine O-methyltransferase Ste14